MKKMLIAATAGLLLSGAASAVDKKTPTNWRIYSFTAQVCHDLGSPSDVMARIRGTYHAEPTAEDVVRDGVVTETEIWFTADNGSQMSVHMFRYAKDCDAYAEQQRGDTSRYK